MAMAERALSEEAISEEDSFNLRPEKTCRIRICGPRSVEEAKEALVRSRDVELELSHPLHYREGMGVEEVMHLTGGNVDAQVVDSFIKLHRLLFFPGEALTLLRMVLQRLSRSNSSQLEYVGSLIWLSASDVEAGANVAEQLGISAEMAETMVDRILPAIDASHHLALAQALEMLLSSGVVEVLRIFTYELSTTYGGWGYFFHRALSSRESRLRTLSIWGQIGGRPSKLLDKGTSRKLFAALSESNLQVLRYAGLDQEEEEILSRAIISPACNLQRLHISYNGTLDQFKHLSSTLVHPNCKIWDWAVLFHSPSQSPSALPIFGDVLRNEKNRLLMLTLARMGTTHCNIPWEAMEDPACKLEALILDTYLEEDGQLALARLLQAASSKIWYLRVRETTKDIVEALKHSKVTHVVVDNPWRDIDVWPLADFLGSAHCKLECFKCLRALSVTDAEVLITALETNYQSRLKTLQISEGNEILQQRCDHIVKRNALFLASSCTHIDQQPLVAATTCGAGKEEALLLASSCNHIALPLEAATTCGEEAHFYQQPLVAAITCGAGKEEARFPDPQLPLVAATSAKLFICGHSGAGKTTIARNFNRRVRCFPAAFQRHSTTQGIDMGSGVLDYNGKKAVIFDIAGQEQFHAFHHYFVKGSQSNLFLVVCKVVTDGDNSNMGNDLKYWLRFISSHTRALSSTRKPKVLIALNYHMHGNGAFNRTNVEVVNELAEKYAGLLDICKNVDDMCFQVVALQVTALKPIKDAVGVALEDVLRNHPQVPCAKKFGIQSKTKTRPADGGAVSRKLSCKIEWSPLRSSHRGCSEQLVILMMTTIRLQGQVL